MLLVIALLAVLAASFGFQVSAHQSAVGAVEERLQLRYAAESGIQHALLLLRENRHNTALWYDNEEFFHNQIVWSQLGDDAERIVPEEIDRESVTYRYSLVADDPEDDLTRIRYGLTDEASKLNINFATRTQLITLFNEVLPDEIAVEPLADALIDWRDQDEEAGPEGAEGDYYLGLEPAYAIKNGMFETVEELLLVKGFTAQILFGEDTDRNGIMTPNEDDGNQLFPLDNQDGNLERGVYPYVTVWSRDLNKSNDNTNRIDLNMPNLQDLRDQLLAYLSEESVNYIVEARHAGQTFGSPAGLYGHAYEVGGDDNRKPGADDAGSDQEPQEEDDAGPGQENPVQFQSPILLEELPVLFDYTTTIRQPGMMGLININTASRAVLKCLVNDRFTLEDVEAVIAARRLVDPELLATPAWLLIEEVISPDALESIYPMITTRSQQFHIEALGHADHIGMMVRLQVIVELRGHVPQYLYYRDISELGTRYPVRGTREGDDVVRRRR